MQTLHKPDRDNWPQWDEFFVAYATKSPPYLGGMMHYRPPIRHFFWGGRIPPVPRGIYATAHGHMQGLGGGPSFFDQRFQGVQPLLYPAYSNSLACNIVTRAQRETFWRDSSKVRWSATEVLCSPWKREATSKLDRGHRKWPSNIQMQVIPDNFSLFSLKHFWGHCTTARVQMKHATCMTNVRRRRPLVAEK